MRTANFAAALTLCTAAFALISCADAGPPSGSAARQASAWYEEQIEEGFGRLDQLPKNRPAVPPRQHTALFAGAPSP